MDSAHRNFLITPAFCKSAMLLDCLQHVYKNGPLDGVQHIIIDNHYPVNKEQNRKEIHQYAADFGCTLIDSGEDLGLHRGFNRAYKIAGIRAGDTLAGLDPDDRPTPGFFTAIRDVMTADPTLAVLGLSFWVIPWKREKGAAFIDEVTAGHNVWIHPNVEMINVSGWNTRFLEDIGGLDQPNSHYGGLEAKLYPLWAQRGLRLGYLPDVRSDHAAVDRNDSRILDPEYRLWKDAHLAGFTESFESWLKIHAPGRL